MAGKRAGLSGCQRTICSIISPTFAQHCKFPLILRSPNLLCFAVCRPIVTDLKLSRHMLSVFVYIGWIFYCIFQYIDSSSHDLL